MKSAQSEFDVAGLRAAADHPDVYGGLNHITTPVELESEESTPTETYPNPRVLLGDPSYLELMDATVVAGRALGPADFSPERSPRSGRSAGSSKPSPRGRAAPGARNEPNRATG